MSVVSHVSAADFLPKRLSLATMRKAADDCRGCELYKRATQTVFGSGLKRARLMLVGEMPGDQEDVQGQPFVGPAGRLLDEVIDEVGIEPHDVYTTNAVKHFRWEPRGKRRLHKKPSTRQIEACKPWLMAEVLVVQPRVIVCLGATAAQALMGRDFRITRQRGKAFSSELAQWMLATYHPSAILRAPDEADRKLKRQQFAADLRVAAAQLSGTR